MAECSPMDRVMQTLRVHVPGATDQLLQLELFNVIDEFFRRTSAWHYEDSIELEEGKSEYAFAIPADSTVVRLLAISHNNEPVPSTVQTGIVQSSLGRLVPELTFPDGDASFAPTVSDINQSNQFTYAIYSPEYIQTTGTITPEMIQYPLLAVLALSLSRSCIEADCGEWSLPDWMYDTFFQDWLDGSLGRLYGMPSKPWSAPTSAAIHARK